MRVAALKVGRVEYYLYLELQVKCIKHTVDPRYNLGPEGGQISEMFGLVKLTPKSIYLIDFCCNSGQ